MIQLAVEHDHHHTHSQDLDDIDHIPCHPRKKQTIFDYSSIQQRIQQIREKKDQIRQATKAIKKERVQSEEIEQIDQIEQAFDQSMDLLPEYISGLVKQKLKLIEDKVYIGTKSKESANGQYMNVIKDQVTSNQAMTDQLNLLMDEIQTNIANSIDQGEYQIQFIKKPKVEEINEKPEPIKRVRVKNKILRNKINDLKSQFDRSEVAQSEIIGTPLHDIKLSQVDQRRSQYIDEFHPKSEQTKKAKEFIKKMQQEQDAKRKEREKRKIQMQSLEVKSMSQKKEFEDQIKKEKHQLIKKRYEEERQAKKLERERQEKITADYLKFLSEYKQRKPLFKIKEEQFIKEKIIQEELKKQHILKEIKQTKKPMSIEQLKHHEKEYLQQKKQKEQRLKSQKKMLKRERSLQDEANKHYKGKFHQIIREQEQQVEPDPNIQRDELLKRRKEYALKVKNEFKPSLSESKRKQLEQMMAQISQNKNKKRIPDDLYKIQGNKYLSQLHKMISILRSQGKIKQTDTPQEVHQKYKDYLKELRQKRASSTIDYGRQSESNIEWVERYAQKLENDAKLKQKVLNYKDKTSFDLQRHMKQIEQINLQYVESAEAKMAIFRKYKNQSQINNSSIRHSQRSDRSQSDY